MNARQLLWLRNRDVGLAREFPAGTPGLHLEALTPAMNAIRQLMWQDSAQTTLVSAYEQPVGKWICPYTGRFVSQSSAGARPTYTARVNVLLNTETLGGTGWTANGGATSLSGQTAPDGTSTAVRITSTAVVNSGYNQGGLTAHGRQQREGIWLRGVSGGEVVSFGDETNRTNVVLTTSWAYYTGTVTKASAFFVVYATGAVAQSWFAWHPDSRTADNASKAIPAYQQVTTSTNYDTDGFPARIVGNGTSQWMSGALDMSSVSQVLSCASVTKNSDASDGMIYALGDPALLSAGTLSMMAPGSSAVTKFQAASRGASDAAVPFTVSATYNAPTTRVVTHSADTGAPSSQLRLDGTVVSTITTSQGGGNYSSGTLYLFARAPGTTQFFNGGISALTIRGGAVLNAQRNNVERYHRNLARLTY